MVAGAIILQTYSGRLRRGLTLKELNEILELLKFQLDGSMEAAISDVFKTHNNEIDSTTFTIILREYGLNEAIGGQLYKIFQTTQFLSFEYFNIIMCILGFDIKKK